MTTGLTNYDVTIEDFDQAMDGSASKEVQQLVIAALENPDSELSRQFNRSRRRAARVIRERYTPTPTATKPTSRVSWSKLDVMLSAISLILFGFSLYSHQGWSRAEETLRPSTVEKNAGIAGRSAIGSDVSLGSQQNRLSVTVQDVVFPIKLYINDQKPLDVFSGDTELEVLTGERIKTVVTASLPLSWTQTYRVVKVKNGQEEILGSVLGQIEFSVEPDSEIRLVMDQPAPPWNAKLIQLSGQPALVTVEAPYPRNGFHGLDRLKDGQLPNAAMRWADVGSEGLATELARFFVENRSTIPASQFRFFVPHSTSLIVPNNGDGFSKNIMQAEQEEIKQILYVAFEELRNHRNASGKQMQDLIDEGQTELQKWNKDKQ